MTEKTKKTLDKIMKYLTKLFNKDPNMHGKITLNIHDGEFPNANRFYTDRLTDEEEGK